MYLYVSNHINVNLIVFFTCSVITQWNALLQGQRKNRLKGDPLIT